MRKAGLLLLALLCFAVVRGQDSLLRTLSAQIKAHPQQDTVRVNRLLDLAEISASPRMLDTLCNEAMAISLKIHYRRGECGALMGLAAFERLRGERKKAIDLLQKAMLIAEEIKSDEHKSYILLEMAKAKASTGENKQALALGLQAYEIGLKIGSRSLQSMCEFYICGLYENSFSDYPHAMEWALKAQQTADDMHSIYVQAKAWDAMASIYTKIDDRQHAMEYYQKALAVNKKLGNRSLVLNLLNSLGELYRTAGRYDDAENSYKEALAMAQTPLSREIFQSNLADVYEASGNLANALKNAFSSLASAKILKDDEGIAWIDGIAGRVYNKLHKPDSAIVFATSGLAAAKQTGTIEYLRDNTGVLTEAYAAKKDFANAYKYHVSYVAYRDSMLNAKVSNRTALLQYNYDLAKKQAQITALNQQKKLQFYLLIGALVIVVLVGIMLVIFIRGNRQKQKANNLLYRQKQIIEEQRDQTNKALSELQSTQTQLVQREKMASLGELTAGIAHEIQNPLNFVNNFSEVSVELLEELREEAEAGHADEVIAIADDLTQNLEKIHHHGKRADSIVKGMLEHSRSSTGQKEPTDLNKLADEYLKLSYHGLRAKDKSFNANMVTQFGEGLPPVNVIGQDIGRVLLNLFNNAFYAISHKAKTADADYKPAVEVTTSLNGNYIQIEVRDNGNGIPESIKDKIMQPFFTTKPTGEGTGLGLSLSYDIVVKGHGGTIAIDSKENEFTAITVAIPQI